MAARSSLPSALALASLLAPALAGAQTRDAEPGSVTVENALAPGPGRIPVRVESTRGGAIPMGVASVAPRAVRRGVSFTTEGNVRFCNAPCTLYLRPGPRRIVGDAESDFAWGADLAVPAQGALRVRVRGHLLGGSAAAGALFFLGLAGAIGGPALMIVSAVVGDPPAPLEVIVAGSLATVGGGLALWGSFALLEWSAPRLESVAPMDPPPPPGSTAHARGPRFTVVPTLDAARGGAGVSALLVF